MGKCTKQRLKKNITNLSESVCEAMEDIQSTDQSSQDQENCDWCKRMHFLDDASLSREGDPCQEETQQ
jgi:hypothetical protein